MEKFKIDKNVVIPPKNARKCKYPFKQMKVGDSFLFPAEDNAKHQTLIANAASAWVRYKKLDWKFATRKTEEGIRIWRIK